MAVLVGTAVLNNQNKSFPAGSQAGDVAVAIIGRPSTAPYFPSGWTNGPDIYQKTTYKPDPQGGFWTIVTYEHGHRLGWKTLTAADLSGDVDLGWPGRVVVFRDTPGVAASRTSASAPVAAGGAVVSMWYTPEGQGDTSGPLTAWSALSWTTYSNNEAFCGYAIASTAGTLGPSPAGGSGASVALLPPDTPGPPSVLEPSDGVQVSAGVDLTVLYRHNPVVDGGYPDAWRAQVSTDAGTTWDYVTATGTLTGTETTVSATGDELTLDGSILSNGDTLLFRMMTREGVDGRWPTSWSNVRTVYPVTPPSVSVTGPTGTVTDDLSPTVTWTSMTPGGAQTGYRVEVLDDGDVIYATGVVDSAGTSWTSPVLDWANGGTYDARVQVRQTGGSWSPWDTTTFTLSWTAPPAPTVTAAPGVHGIDVTLGGITAGDTVELQRSSGAEWVVVSTVTADTDDPTVTDVAAPYGVPVQYRTRTMLDLEGAVLPGAWGTSPSVTSTDPRAYLIDAAAPLSRWAVAAWSSDRSRVHGQDTSVVYGLGDSSPRVTYGTYRGQSGTWAFRARTHDDRDTLLGLLHSGGTLRLRTAAELERTPSGLQRVDTGSVLFKRVGQVRVSRYLDSPIAGRLVEVDWVEASPVYPVDDLTVYHVTLDVTGANITEAPGGTILITVED